MLFCAQSVLAKGYETDPEAWIDEDREFKEHVWKEQKVPLPPYPDEDDLQEVPESAAKNTFQIFVDKKHLTITPDEVIHYTVVAVSKQGVRNVFFEGLRCHDGLYKLYGYGTNKGKAVESHKPQWQPVAASRHQDYRVRFHGLYMCSQYGQTETVKTILDRLKYDESSETDGGRILGGDNVGW